MMLNPSAYRGIPEVVLGLDAFLRLAGVAEATYLAPNLLGEPMGRLGALTSSSFREKSLA